MILKKGLLTALEKVKKILRKAIKSFEYLFWVGRLSMANQHFFKNGLTPNKAWFWRRFQDDFNGDNHGYLS